MLFTKDQYVAILSTMLFIIGYGGSESLRIQCDFVKETSPVFSDHIEASNLAKKMSYIERGRLLCVINLNENQIEKIKSWWSDCLRVCHFDLSTSMGYEKYCEKMSAVYALSLENGIPVLDIDQYI